MVTSKASATWNGVLKSGDGEFGASSGSFEGAYTFATRFEGKKGATPEELIAAAHAACFSMALAAGLEKAGTPATTVRTTAACTLEFVDGAPTITKMDLTVRGTVDGLDNDGFVEAATDAKEDCPVSRLLKSGLTISMDAALES
jgi:osmotically inducible protein OsmC